MVFVHELGHFLAARAMGVEVKEFAFGFPPRIYKKKKGRTTYILNLLPIGGYVQLLGEHGEEAKSEKSLAQKKPWQKAIIFVAGVAMNILLAWIILTIFYAVGGRAIIGGMWEHPGVTNNQKALVKEIEKGSPAEKAGVTKGEKIISVNGNIVYSPEMVIVEIQKSQETVNLKTEKQEYTILPNDEKRIGVSLDVDGKISAPWYRAPIIALQETYRITKLTVVEFGKFLSLVVTKGRISEGVGGPVAIVKVTGVVASLGFAPLLQLVILLSISLAIFNILPFPALDGGHILLLGIEKVIGREIKREHKEAINKLGFILLLLLAAWITFKDLGRFGILK